MADLHVGENGTGTGLGTDASNDGVDLDGFALGDENLEKNAPGG